jgi:peptidoglycan/LPS O-acetylase OafA/YrhL
MQVTVINTPLQNLLFESIFLLLLVASVKKLPTPTIQFTPKLTEELKGFAILIIIFSHIGYFLSTDTNFLQPFSYAAGVGVNLFLFLSGLGITISQINNDLNPLQFYKKRLSKLLIPMWVVLTLFIIIDALFLGIHYPTTNILKSYLGFFPRANLFLDIDSPLWYFSMILFCYLIFPLTWIKKMEWISPVLQVIIFYFVIHYLKLPVDQGVFELYRVHVWAFPIGVTLALLMNIPPSSFRNSLLKNINFLKTNFIINWILFIILLSGFCYYAVHSGVGEGVKVEQTISLLSIILIVSAFYLKNFYFRLLQLFGKYSYEIYLLHWPLLFRYDIFYKILPAALSTFLYLGLFLTLGFLMQKVMRRVL